MGGRLMEPCGLWSQPDIQVCKCSGTLHVISWALGENIPKAGLQAHPSCPGLREDTSVLPCSTSLWLLDSQPLRPLSPTVEARSFLGTTEARLLKCARSP